MRKNFWRPNRNCAVTTNKMVKSYGRIPTNAGCIIDYAKGKPSVKWRYPDRTPRVQSAIVALGILLLIVLIIYLALLLFVYLAPTTNAPTNCNVTYGYNQTKVMNFTIECPNYWDFENSIKETYEFNSERISLFDNNKFLKTTYINSLGGHYFLRHLDYAGMNPWLYLFLTILGVILVYSLSIVGVGYMTLGFPNSKLGIKIGRKLKLDKLQSNEQKYLIGRGYFIKFKEVPANKIIEIPLFKNNLLDYKAKGEFSKYLLRVETTEHPFSKGVFAIKKIRGKKIIRIKNKKKNIYLWKAQFIFSDIPKNGELEVRFK